jgi:hypothetical protein
MFCWIREYGLRRRLSADGARVRRVGTVFGKASKSLTRNVCYI